MPAWEEKNPHEHETGSHLEVGIRTLGPFYTFGEVSLKNRASHIRCEMDKLHGDVMTSQDVVPPDPPGPKSRWKFRGK